MKTIDHMAKEYQAPEDKFVEIETKVDRTDHDVKLTVSYSLKLNDLDDNFPYEALRFFCIHRRKSAKDMKKELYEHISATNGHEFAIGRIVGG